ncbi:hypothetical protein [Lacrimispora indolis]|uniref:hypothetical protein n=1 Tax=Lacrimispora indolis TaxID=69825 RepID=UPI00040CDEC9|nr:hypothetical protein [[Clostridium] methoxybenzovorans]
MTYIITNGEIFLKRDKNNQLITTKIQNEALKFHDYEKAENILKCIPKTYREYSMNIKKIGKDSSKNVDEEIDVKSKLLDVQDFISYTEARKNYLNKLLSQEDMKIVDIEHAAEFYKLNASQGYKLYKMLREARINRRKYKDELEEIESLRKYGFNMLRTDEMIEEIKKLDNRRYNPRVLEELFNYR